MFQHPRIAAEHGHNPTRELAFFHIPILPRLCFSTIMPALGPPIDSNIRTIAAKLSKAPPAGTQAAPPMVVSSRSAGLSRRALEERPRSRENVSPESGAPRHLTPL
jgi:hypothetical protein